jgi:hypothetical protein
MNLQERIDKDAETALEKKLQDWSFILKNLKGSDLIPFFTTEDHDNIVVGNVCIADPNYNQMYDRDYIYSVKKHMRERLLPKFIQDFTNAFYDKINNSTTK